MVPIRGGSEAFHAYAADTEDDHLDRHPRRGRSSTSRHGPSSSARCRAASKGRAMDPLILAGGSSSSAWSSCSSIFKLMWRVAEPNEALVISGLREHSSPEGAGESLGFRSSPARARSCCPGVQTVRRLSLDLREADAAIECVTHQGIPLGIRGVVIYKVGDDFVVDRQRRPPLPRPAGRRWTPRVHNVFAGHLRAIVGNMTVEEMIRDREKLTALTRESSGIGDGEARPDRRLAAGPGDRGPDRLHHATSAGPTPPRSSAEARIAQAARRPGGDRAPSRGPTPSRPRPGASSQIKQAGYQAEIDKAAAQAQQAGPLADASARQEVVVEETKVAELEAQREEQRLQATVRKPADAKAYEQVTLAKAERDARISGAEAERQEVELARRRPSRPQRVPSWRPVAEAERVRLDAIARVRVDPAHRRGRGGRHRGQGPGRGRGRAGQGHGRGRGDQGPGRRPGREPGRRHRPAAGREVAGDRRGGGQAVRRRSTR